MGVFRQITDDGFPGAKSLDFIGQRIVYAEPFGRYWGWSSLVDGSSWNSLDQAQAETSPDRIQGLIVSHNEVLVFGERTIEPWASAPTDTAVFQLQTGSVIECGCASGKTIQRLDNSVFFLTNNGQIARLNGYTPLVVSTAAMEASIRGLNWARAFAFTWEDAGHVVYYITFPDGMTWGFDVRQNKWHRRESYGLDRWRINALAKSNGKWIAGDFQSGLIYELEWGYVYEGCEIMPRKIRTGVLHNAGNRVTVNALRLNVATGGPPSEPDCPPVPEPTPTYLVITGAFSGSNKFSESLSDPVSIQAIPSASGADINAQGSAAYGGDTWVALGSNTDGGRFSVDERQTWLPSTIVGSAGTFSPKHHVYGNRQFVAAGTPLTGEVAISNWPPSVYSVVAVPFSNSITSLGYAKGFYYYGTQNGMLYRTHDFVTVFGLEDGLGSGDDYHFYFQFNEYNGYVYATRFSNNDLLSKRHQLVRSASGLFDDVEIIVNLPANEGKPLYWMSIVRGVLVVYKSNGHILASLDNFATERPITGLSNPPLITSGPLMEGARKMTSSGGRLFIMGQTPGQSQIAYTDDLSTFTITTTAQSTTTSIVGMGDVE